MVFKRNRQKYRKWHVEQAVTSYLEWLANGHPASAWSYSSGEYSFIGKNMMGAADSESVPLNDDDIQVARAKGQKVRYDRLMALMSSEDKNIAVKLGVLKQTREEFFGSDEQQEAVQSLLSRALTKVVKFQLESKEKDAERARQN